MDYYNYPHTDLNAQNQNWLIQQMKSLIAEYDKYENPVVVEYANQMVDTTKIYIYQGNEAGFNTTHWYFWYNDAWTDGGKWGSVDITDEELQAAVNTWLNAHPEATTTVQDGSITTAKLAPAVLNYTFTRKFYIPRCFFWGRQEHKSSTDTYANLDSCGSTEPFTFHSPVRIIAESNTANFFVHYTDTLSSSGAQTDYIVEAERPFVLQIKAVTGDFVASMIGTIALYTDEAGYKSYLDDYTTNMDMTSRLESDNVSKYLFAGDYWLTDEMFGCRTRHTYLYRRAASRPIIATEDITLFVGVFQSQTLLYIPQSATTEAQSTALTANDTLTIPKGTVFTLRITSNSQNVDNPPGRAVIACIDDKDNGPVMYQQCANRNTSIRTDAGFKDSLGNFFFINYNGEYFHRIGDTMSTAVTLDHSPGHANSCNYVANTHKCYVSDWTDGTLIHVYSVDEVNGTMSWDKDITIPFVGGRCEYFVCDSAEKQVIGLGWDYEGGLEGSYLILTGWIKSGTTYLKSWEKLLPRPTVLQGFCVHDNCVYYIETESSPNYHFIAIHKVNMASGIDVIFTQPSSGSILSNEVEGIFHAEGQLFYAFDRFGGMYLCGYPDM